MRGRALAAMLLAMVVPCVLVAPSPRRDPGIVRGPRGVVVSVDRAASRVGARILERGGNAVDAAVATALALAVTYPRAGNLGGGGFMMIRMADGHEAMIDYRETAPAGAGPGMYLDAQGEVARGRSTVGYLAPGTPGTVPGLALAWRRFGALPWEELVEPAIRIARRGFRVDRDTARSLRRAAPKLARFPASARIFLRPGGLPLQEGDLLVQGDLAWSLEEIRRDKEEAIRRGELARRIAGDVERHGGVLRPGDLAAYRAVVRAPLHIRYRERFEILAPPLPSSGGITLAMMLHFLERFDVAAAPPDSPETVHLLAEAMRRAFRDRAAYLGDADRVDVPVAALLDPAHVEPWVREFRRDRATPSLSIRGDIPVVQGPEGHDTTHFCVADAQGNVVSNTTTINDSYGSKVVAEGTGILLNDEMDDFNLSERTVEDGAIGTAPNRIAPGKRMLSSMTPILLLRDGEVVLAVGSPGGRSIINTVLRIVVNLVDFGMTPRQAVDAPRFHQQWLPDELVVEEGGFPEAALSDLRARGHRVRLTEFQGDAHTVARAPGSGEWVGVADHRIDGAAAAAFER